MKAAADSSITVGLSASAVGRARRARWLTRHRRVVIGGSILSLVVLAGVLAPFLGTTDPTRIDPS